ncbi:MAG: T9SS type A sorting domain-containing protein [Rhodothermales bacterium]|nr:T9SS type A sorting domain-containing protein [Rhodothermales bacterium]
MYFRMLLTGLILSTILVVPSAMAQSLEAKLTASDGSANDLFGTSVSISGSRILVGAFSDDEVAVDAGAIYVFENNGSAWAEAAKLTASSGSEADRLGFDSFIYGDFAIAGAAFEDHSDQKVDAGAAYIFHFDGTSWAEQARLTASDSEEDDQFGWTVSITDSVAVVGSTWDDNYTGAVYVYRYDGSTWTEEAKLTASDSIEGQRFGGSIHIFNDRIIVGARFDQDLGSGAGAAYIFKYDGSAWLEEAKLTASDGAPGDNFGDAVSIDDDLAIVGASRLNGLIGVSAGGAYVFRYDGATWTEEAMLLAGDASGASRFGNSVAIQGNRAFIGAFEEDEIATNAGSAYVFNYDGTGWVQETKINESELQTGDGFGNSVAIAGDVVIAGAPNVDLDATSNAGAVYVYELQPFNPVSVEDAPRAGQVVLHDAYPNPTTGQTTVSFELAVPGRVVIEVYDLLGRLISSVAEDAARSGRTSVTWNGTNLQGELVPSGTYILRLRVDGSKDLPVDAKTVVVVR